ncbi:MAG TPA: protein-methionine-sulfoxide reductase catalytic subunit MsrP [Gammaproteobacteria bacterium]|nr:protein-methionine-sulfoxide reductase catalytic subunit MsrP [Gammaproteobacteria bacterium]
MTMSKPNAIRPSEITPEAVFVNRRALLKAAVAAGLVPGVLTQTDAATIPANGAFADVKRWPGSADEKPNSFEDITTYNNYYEFGTGKGDPSSNAGTLVTKPWSVAVTGEAARPGTYTLEDVLAPHTLEDRIYRLRCVEAWSLVIPWVGFPLADLLKRFEPTSQAKYVQFFTLQDRNQMPGLRERVLEWPYREGLTIAEAMHPLALATVGLYGKVLPNQNGAPLRLVVPWKYGFKSIKSIVRIHFTATQPQTSWNMAAPREYGFYSNVNPNVDHPRWSQATERRLGGGLFSARIPTQMFNGYAEEVAHLYSGLDLVKNY